MKAIGRVLGLALLAWFGTMAAAAAMALQRKQERSVTPPDEGADEIDLVAIFESVEFKSHASAFRGGTVEYRFGGGSIDLRGATLHPEGATLRTTAIFGGGQVLVPNDWVVETHVTGVGGVGDARPSARSGEPRRDGAPILTIEGTVVFGGFGGMSTDPRPEAHETPVAV